MRWLVDLIQALLGRRTPEQGAAVVLPSDAAAEGARVAVANAAAARSNAAQVDALQLYAGQAMMLCGNQIPPTTAPSK